jgi:hypothetical protein
MAKASFVEWYLIPSGYAVDTFDSDCQPLDEYRAGNSPGCSQTFLPRGHKFALRKSTLRKFAKQTARETAERFGLGAARIFHSPDSEASACEQVI